MVTLELNADEARFLLEQMKIHRRHVEEELAHTDARSMQADLASDLERLDRMRTRIEGLMHN
jgi:hypothetical protein